jgi:hypothetical protein
MRSPTAREVAAFLAIGVLVPTGAGCQIITSIDDGAIKNGACSLSCTTVGGCPAPASECLEVVCDKACCDPAPRKADAKCKGGVCDGLGACVACNTKEQCPVSSTACKANACNAHQCGTTSAPLGTVCTDGGGRVCDAAGACVQCNTTVDCGSSGTVACHPSKLCVPPACANGQKDGTETDVDCGGDTTTCPARCAKGAGCTAASDCARGNCDADSKTCL